MPAARIYVSAYAYLYQHHIFAYHRYRHMPHGNDVSLPPLGAARWLFQLQGLHRGG